MAMLLFIVTVDIFISRGGNTWLTMTRFSCQFLNVFISLYLVQLLTYLSCFIGRLWPYCVRDKKVALFGEGGKSSGTQYRMTVLHPFIYKHP